MRKQSLFSTPKNLDLYQIIVYTVFMLYEWDEAKNARNVLERGLDFSLVEDFDWDDAFIVEDARTDYGERRLRALGLIANKLHALVYTMRGDVLRIISLRRANKREGVIYEKARKTGSV